MFRNKFCKWSDRDLKQEIRLQRPHRQNRVQQQLQHIKYIYPDVTVLMHVKLRCIGCARLKVVQYFQNLIDY